MSEEKVKRAVRKLDTDATITVAEDKKVRAGSKREAYLGVAKESDTIGEYFAAVEDRSEARSFLVWFLDNGYVVAE